MPCTGKKLTIWLGGASSVVLFGLLRWRARNRARSSAEHAEKMVEEGAMIKFENGTFRQEILERARNRANKWLSFQVSGADQLVGQVGGVSKHKRPVLILEPDYVLKPLAIDHRGIRELGFYEALNAASHTSGTRVYADFIAPKREAVAPSIIDVIAFSLAFVLKDPYVLDCERRITRAWEDVEREAKMLRRLYRFVPSYFGMVRHETSSVSFEEAFDLPCPYGIQLDCYLLLQDVTVNFKKPCVIDLKLGFHTFEPDAPDDKKSRERKKYPQQETFGFRIVGKRIYIPSHRDADENGFVFYPKSVGRSLESYESLMDAFVTFFGLEPMDEFASDRLKIVSNILLKVRSLEHWFRDNKSFCFTASSLLIAYEGDVEGGSNPDMVTTTMIDFGRVRRKKGGDEGCLKGLSTIVSMLEEISTEWSDRIR